MQQATRGSSLQNKCAKKTTLERKQLAESLGRTQVLIQQAYSSFNNVKDRDLVESYVFEINALQSRYNFLLRRLKELEGAP